MKKTSLLFGIVLLYSLSLFAQTEQSKELLQRDTILAKIYEHLPQGWILEFSDTALLVYRTEKIVTIDIDCNNINIDSLDKYEKNEIAYIHFRYEDKWDSDKIFWIREWNDSLNLRLAMLPQEYGVSHLYDKEKSTRINRVYTGKNKSEKEKVKKYYERRAEISSHINPIPNFNTTTLSLKIIRQTGLQFPGQCVIPYHAYKESMAVYVLFLEYCENPLMK